MLTGASMANSDTILQQVVLNDVADDAILVKVATPPPLCQSLH